MAGLHPGPLFNNAGFNRRYTPLRLDQYTPKLDQEQSSNPKSTIDDQLLFRPSPIAKVYDATNTSSRLILLNKKLLNRSKGSRLRVHYEYKCDKEHPEPERHFSDNPRLNSSHHKKCTKSESERFFPKISSDNYGSADKQSQRKDDKVTGNSDSNHVDHDVIRLFKSLQRPPRLTAERQHQLSPKMSSVINDPILKHGERHYLASIVQIYGVEHMRQQKIQQYNQLMWKEISKGNYSSKDVKKYFKYLSRPNTALDSSSASLLERRRLQDRPRANTALPGRKSPSSSMAISKKSSKVGMKPFSCTKAIIRNDGAKFQCLRITIRKKAKTTDLKKRNSDSDEKISEVMIANMASSEDSSMLKTSSSASSLKDDSSSLELSSISSESDSESFSDEEGEPKKSPTAQDMNKERKKTITVKEDNLSGLPDYKPYNLKEQELSIDNEDHSYKQQETQEKSKNKIEKENKDELEKLDFDSNLNSDNNKTFKIEAGDKEEKSIEKEEFQSKIEFKADTEENSEIERDSFFDFEDNNTKIDQHDSNELDNNMNETDSEADNTNNLKTIENISQHEMKEINKLIEDNELGTADQLVDERRLSDDDAKNTKPEITPDNSNVETSEAFWTLPDQPGLSANRNTSADPGGGVVNTAVTETDNNNDDPNDKNDISVARRVEADNNKEPESVQEIQVKKDKNSEASSGIEDSISDSSSSSDDEDHK